MEPAILINFGTLSKPTYCLSESSLENHLITGFHTLF